MLPCTQSEFAEFISGLLGKPQTIDRWFDDSFLLSRDDVESLYALVIQRISSQNESSLIGFSIRLSYEDNSSVLLNSFEEFRTYNEVKPLVSTGISLNWRWLVKFSHSHVPEKQEIDVAFQAQKARWSGDRILVSSSETRSKMTSRISHTNRSWGSDLDLLIMGFLQDRIQPEKVFRKYMRRWSAWAGLCAGSLVTLSLIVLILGIYAEIGRRAYVSALSVWVESDMSPIDVISGKIDFLISQTPGFVSPIGSFLQFVFLSFSVFVGIGIGVLVNIETEQQSPSAVAITRQAVVRRDAMLKAYEKSFSRTMWGAAGMILASVVVKLLVGALMPFLPS